MAISAYSVSLPLLWWMSPVILGLVLAVPVALLSSRSARPDRHVLLVTPEQTAPPRVLLRANELAAAPPPETALSPLHALRDDPQLLDAHLDAIAHKPPRSRGQIDPYLALARARIEEAENFEEAVGFLNSREMFSVLRSRSGLQAILRIPSHPE